MIHKFVFFSLLTVQVFAQEPNLHCQDEVRFLTFVDDVMNVLPGKVCPTNDERIIERVEKEYNQFYGKLPKVKQAVKGFNLTGSAKELKIASDMLGAKVTKGWALAAKDCATIICAFEKLFKSKEAAMQVMNIHAKSGYSLSLDQTINQNLADQIWSAKEVREIDAMVTKLPPELRRLPNLNGIERMADGLRKKDHSERTAAYASPSITGYKKADLVSYDLGMRGLSNGKDAYENSSSPQETIMHEICHHHDFKGYYATDHGTMTSEQKNSSWRKLSGWKEEVSSMGESTWVSGPGSQFVSWYAETAPAEDYAESCSSYVLDPKTLLAKAPKKYAFMKQHLFGGKEFTEMPWTGGKVKAWPKLNDLVADESSCNAKLAECAQDIKYNGSFCSKTQYSCSTAIAQIQNNNCFKAFKATRLKEMITTLEFDTNFCEAGGKQTVEQQIDKICSQSASALAKTLEAAVKLDLKATTANCEAQNDYTSDCILKSSIAELKVPETLAPTINKILATSIPNRMSALANKLESINTGVWLKACMDSVSGISQYTIQNTSEKIYSYDSKSEEFTGSFLGKYIYDDYDRKDINLSCGQQMITKLKESGIKTPESGSAVNLMKKPFLAELRSFESEVLGEIPAAINKCLFSGCRVKKIMELLVAWEQKSPEKRMGFATKEYAEELKNKIQ